MDEQKELTGTITTLSALLDEMSDLSQPRTNFALSHFVVGQHDLPGRQYQQVLNELQSLLFALGDMYDDMEEAKLDFEDAAFMPEGRAEVAERRALRKQEAIRIQIKGRMREVEYLLGLLNSMPKYTLADIEREEAEYWSRRLSRQHFEALLGDPGDLDAIIQMFTNPGEPKPQLAGLADILPRLGGLGKQLEAATPKLLEGDASCFNSLQLGGPQSQK